jgi:hypothetical protein
MGKASSSKKVARAARAGGSRRAGQRRAMGFPIAVGVVIVVGLLLVVFARERRNADAFPRANQDHVHSAFDIYTCVTETDSEGNPTTTTSSTETTTTSTTTTTAPADASTTSTSTSTTTSSTSTTIAATGDVPGEYAPPVADVTTDVEGIHSHGDGLIHIHPFVSSAAGRNATLGVFLDQVGVQVTDDTLTLPSGTVFKEGKSKCQGGKDGIVQVAKWDKVQDAAAGAKPNQIFTSDFDKIRLGANQAYTLAFMPQSSTIPAKPDVADRISKVSDLPTSSSSTTIPASGAPSDSGSGAPASDSGAPASDSGAPASTDTTSVSSETTTTTAN